ncbi:alpha/beta fold hydrolase [Paenibacillus nasutitermitis]|uniref:Alpha/beta hydrolase n=1 Tax=Paenibacillus nasutitermitis TaxID=1652958 RepID=A0A917DW82_9BACL|nr:alpha/beta fold hydrolase [Paenibacillus nasutitermitis]GGD74522.1 alpha/beta hydrolase [Paenibacillus nasutitermitis]
MKTKKHWRRSVFWIVGILLFLVAGAMAAYRYWVYPPASEALTALKSDESVRIAESGNEIVFDPVREPVQPSVIFYPGALVDPEAYSPWARALAQRGSRVYIVSMPLNLAIFGQSRADAIIDAHPGESFVLGGHSLGGAFAARYATAHPEKLKGVFFLASYADKKGDLSGTQLPVLQLTGSRDGILSLDKRTEGEQYLPASAEYVSIEGGNHAQFGSYGPQRGDLAPVITEQAQHERIVSAMADWLASIK